MRTAMVRSKLFPRLSGVFLRWINNEEFVVEIAGKELVGHRDYWEGDFPMCKCDTCKVQMEINDSDVPACCKWPMDNVVIGGKNLDDCDMYEPVEEA